MTKRNRKAFTIVELVIVIAVIAILAAVMIPVFGSIIQNANNATALAELRDIKLKVQTEVLPDNVWEFEDGDGNTITIRQNADGTLWAEGADNLADALNSCPALDGYGSFTESGANLVYTTKNGNGTATWENIVGVDPDEPEVSYSSNLYYTLVDGTYTLTIAEYCKDTEIRIPSTHNGISVTGIGKGAFSENTQMTSVIIPGSITTIEESAFAGCYRLEKIIMSEGVKTIKTAAFSFCSNLTSITLPSTLETIGGSAFANCSSLEEIEIPKSVTSLGIQAFTNCENIKSIKINGSIDKIGQHTFSECWSLEHVTLPEGLTEIDSSAFWECYSLTSINIPNSVTNISKGTFSHCEILSEIHYEGTVEQWKAINEDDSWQKYSGTFTIYCTDGTIARDGTVTLS